MCALPNANLPRMLAVDFSKTLDPFFADLFGEGVGYVAVSYGKVPNKVTFYEWPAQKDQLVADAERRNKTTNVFYCPVLRQTTDVTDKGGLSAEVSRPVEPMPCLWADVDLVDDEGNPKDVNHTLLQRLARKGAWRVQSGRRGHEHVYFPLAEPVDLAKFERLNKDLKNALGADHAQSHAKWLRLPTYLTHKPVLAAPREVMIAKAPTKRFFADELQDLICPQRTRKAREGRRQGTRTPGAQRATEARVRRLLRRYATEAGDKSDQFAAVVMAGVEDGVSLDRLEALLDGHPVTPDRYEGRLRQEIERVADGHDAPADDADLVDAEPTWVTFSDVQERKVEWLWYGWLPTGKLVMMDGDPGVSKSTLALTIAAHITRGKDWPDGRRCPEGDVILLSAEDDPDDTMKPRLRLAGAKMDRVHLLTEVRDGDVRRPPTLGDVGPMRQMIERFSAKLVIVDVFMSYVPGKADSHKDQDVRAFLMHLKNLAQETGCAFLMLRHLNKSGGSNAKHRGGGSIGITGQARAVWTVGEDHEQPDVKVLSSAKVNNAPKPRSLAYMLDFDEESETGRVRWIGESDLRADDLVTETTPKKDGTRRSEAETFLMGLLTDAGGSMPSAELTEAMVAAGFSTGTTQRAKKALGVKSKKNSMDGPWMSCLPDAHARA